MQILSLSIFIDFHFTYIERFFLSHNNWISNHLILVPIMFSGKYLVMSQHFADQIIVAPDILTSITGS